MGARCRRLANARKVPTWGACATPRMQYPPERLIGALNSGLLRSGGTQAAPDEVARGMNASKNGFGHDASGYRLYTPNWNFVVDAQPSEHVLRGVLKSRPVM